MKKKYMQPTIEVEHFVLTQAIAGCHPAYIVHSVSSDCILNSENSTPEMRDLAHAGLWLEIGNCRGSAEGMIGSDGLCYHTNMNAVFRS